jgi:hypothetical protein
MRHRIVLRILPQLQRTSVYLFRVLVIALITQHSC